MSIYQSIQKWIHDGQVYVEGVRIYRQIGGSYPLHYFEQYCEAPFVPTEVEAHLYFFLSTYDGPDQSDSTSIPQSIDTPAISPIQRPEDPTIIQQLRQKAKSLHKQHDYQKGQLHQASSPQERYEIAQSIMEVTIPALDKTYHQLRVYEQTGALPSMNADPDLVATIVKKMQHRETLKSRLSRLKGLLKKTTDGETRGKYRKEQIAKALELAELEQELGLHE